MMEAIVRGRNHHHVHHHLFSAKPPFDKCLHDVTPKDSILHRSLCSFLDNDVDSLCSYGNGRMASCSVWSHSFSKSFDSDGNRFESNGECHANGYHSDGAYEMLESSELVNHAEQNKQNSNNYCNNRHVAVEREGIVDTKSVESIVENFVAPLQVPPCEEVLDLDVNQCYCPDERSSRASANSSLVVSAFPLPPSPVFNRCQTTPTSDGNAHAPDLLRSSSDKGKKQSETLCQVTSPVEILLERKKKKIIENLVRVKNVGIMEVDVDCGSEVTSTLLETDVAVDSSANVEDNREESTMPSYLEIAMLIVGTRGDVQPFVAIGKRLMERGHRVRLATHANFRNFVTSNGLEFYPLGGDPKALAGYMVKNKGFLPSGPSEVSVQKKHLKAIMSSLLPACTKADGDSGAPFKTDAIIANPTAYGQAHVAEYLDVPLHIFFTMPWTATNEFPHPLARVKQQAGYRMSYRAVDSLIWWVTRDLINEFRVNELKLNPMNYFNGNQGSIAHLPTGYMWSPHLVPKPKDWGQQVDVVGFCFLNLANEYKPPDALVKWLATGEKPIYVGFGSLPVEHPGKMTEIIVKALEETKQRGIIDKGWGGLGILKETSESVLFLENCPHDWLFPQCAAVVHHGGSGTTAAGLKAGCPTTIVPFFGDQPFWGERVCEKGVGPPPIPVQQFSLERLVQAIKFMQDPEVKQRALELAIQIKEEDGAEVAVDAFYRHWVRGPAKASMTTETLSWFQTFLIRLRRLWCLPWCFE